MKYILRLTIAISCVSVLSCTKDSNVVLNNNYGSTSNASSRSISGGTNNSAETVASADQTDPIGGDADIRLMESACKGEEVGVADALRGRANPNIHDGTGKTPLMCAALNLPIVKMLLDAGAKVNPVDQFGNSALLLACRSVKYDIARLLVEKGANVNVAAQDGVTPLMIIVRSRFDELDIEMSKMSTVRVLIEKGANVNFTDKRGVTPLCIALSAIPTYQIADVEFEIVQLLVNSKANVNVKCESYSSLVGFVTAQITSNQGQINQNQIELERMRSPESRMNQLEYIQGLQKQISNLRDAINRWERVKSLLINAGAR